MFKFIKVWLIDRELANRHLQLLQELKNYDAQEMKNCDAELFNYQRKHKLNIDVEVEKFRAEKAKQIEALALQCARQTGEYEHTFHSSKEQKGIEIAKLEAKLEALKESEELHRKVAEGYKIILDSKEKEVQNLSRLLEASINKPVLLSFDGWAAANKPR
jgi:hypothetical protein